MFLEEIYLNLTIPETSAVILGHITTLHGVQTAVHDLHSFSEVYMYSNYLFNTKTLI